MVYRIDLTSEQRNAAMYALMVQRNAIEGRMLGLELPGEVRDMLEKDRKAMDGAIEALKKAEVVD